MKNVRRNTLSRGEGATLYLSWQDAILAGFEKLTGMKVISNAMRQNPNATVSLPGLQTELTLHNERRMKLAICQDGEILGAEADGNPAFICHPYGSGRVYFLSFPMERVLADQPGAFENTEYYRLFQLMFSGIADRRITAKSSPQLAVTEHPMDENRCTVVAQSYSPEGTYRLTVKDGWHLQSVEYGKVSQNTDGSLLLEIAENNICRFILKK